MTTTRDFDPGMVAVPGLDCTSPRVSRPCTFSEIDIDRLERQTSAKLRPTASVLLSVAALVVICAGMRAATWLLLPAVLAVFVTLMVVPLLGYLRALGVPRWLSVVGVMLVVLATLVGSGLLLGRIFHDSLQTLSEYESLFSSAGASLGERLAELGLEISVESLSVIDPGELLVQAGTVAGSLLSLAANILFVTVMVGFMLVETGGFGHKLDVALGCHAARRERLIEAVASVRRYVWLKTLISLGTGVLAGVACWMTDVEAPLLWGVVAFALNFIPMLGSLIAAVPPVLLALGQGWTDALALGLAYLLINIVMGQVLEPRLLGERLGLSAAVILLSLLFWGWIFGPLGMLLAVPFTMIVQKYCEFHDELRWLAVLLSSSAIVDGTTAPGSVVEGIESEQQPIISRVPLGSVGI